jgi:hypothetical protein
MNFVSTRFLTLQNMLERTKHTSEESQRKLAEQQTTLADTQAHLRSLNEAHEQLVKQSRQEIEGLRAQLRETQAVVTQQQQALESSHQMDLALQKLVAEQEAQLQRNVERERDLTNAVQMLQEARQLLTQQLDDARLVYVRFHDPIY